jgi:putative FmdB family regulatory protein
VATYEYICEECGYYFEVSQSMNDAPLNNCPECKGKVRRKISGGSGFIMKGTEYQKTVQTRCGNDQTCCGSTIPCESPGCEN